jgi:hypothetical protein
VILRLSLGAIALFAIGGTAVSLTALIGSGDRAMALWTLFYAWMAAVCGLSAVIPAAPKGGDEP